jgi:Mg-chelatase subunit ChlD
VTAKYLKIQIAEGYGAEYVRIPEIHVRGYFKQAAARLGSPGDLGDIDLEEQEPNDSPDTAQTLPVEVRLGAAAAEDDADYYHLAPAEGSGDTLVVDLDHIGMVRPECALLTRDGQEISPARMQYLPAGRRLEYAVTPSAHHYLRVVRPETYLTIVYDDSSSMEKSVTIVKRVLRGYLDRLGARLHIKLVTYADKPKDLCDFTNDPRELEAAIKGKVGIGGGTDTFRGLMWAINRVKEKKGNRAVLAIFDVIDGADKPLQQYLELWDSLLDTGISFSTIGVQSGWDERTEFFGNSRQRIFHEIAYATQGEFHHTPTDATIEQSANAIFDQLTTPTPYAVRVHWKTRVRRPGWIQLAFHEGAGSETARNVELILDASYSMWDKMGGTQKIVVARQVLQQVIQKLPAEIHVGLRVFGHRYHTRDRRTNTDTELLLPLGPLDKSRLIGTINQIDPKGKTPLVHSILQAQDDFQEVGKGTLVVVSDGLETCGGDIHSIAPALKNSGLELRVNIVGFGIEQRSARAQLEAIAESTGGRYLDAGNPEELLASLQKTLHVEFVVLNDEGVEQTRGLVGGEPAEVPEGNYTLRLLLEGEPLQSNIVVCPGKTHSFVLQKPADRWLFRAD